MDLDRSSEELREALLDLERSRDREAQLRRESESLLRGLRAMATIGEPDAMFAQIFTNLRELLGFEHALIAVEQQPGEFSTSAATSRLYLGTHWSEGPTFARTLAGKPVAVYDVTQVPEWCEQPPPVRAPVASALHLALFGTDKRAILICTHPRRGFFGRSHSKVASRFGDLASEALHRLQVAEQLAETNRRLLDSVRRAGMAEIATNVLHRMGNSLNSVSVSIGVLRERLSKTRVDKLGKVADLLGKVGNDARSNGTGSIDAKHLGQIAAYVAGVAAESQRDNRELLGETDRLQSKLEEIESTVRLQQQHAGSSEVVEPAELSQLVDDAIRLCEACFDRVRVDLAAELAAYPKINVDRHKLVQILVTLLSNAVDATVENEGERRVEVRLVSDETSGTIHLLICDNGRGISQHDLKRVFEYGFSTKEGTASGALHSAALTARELHGMLTAESDGPGKGAAFRLTLRDRLLATHDNSDVTQPQNPQPSSEMRRTQRQSHSTSQQ